MLDLQQVLELDVKLPPNDIQKVLDEISVTTQMTQKSWEFCIFTSDCSAKYVCVKAKHDPQSSSNSLHIAWTSFSATTTIPYLYYNVERSRCTGRRYGFFGPQEYDRWTEHVARGITAAEIDIVQQALRKAITEDAQYAICAK